MTTPDRAAAPAPLAERLLLPCPCCNGEPSSGVMTGEGAVIFCLECELTTRGFGWPENDTDSRPLTLAIAAWNRRAPTLLAALDGREAGWLPIESAPTDQTAVDLWQSSCGYYTGGAERIADAFCEGGGRWVIDQRGGDNIEIDMTFVTHWRPTTEGPQSALSRPQPAGEPE